MFNGIFNERSFGHSWLTAPLLVALTTALGACAAPPYEARATYPPAAAATVLRERPAHAWLLQGTQRIDLGVGARIDATGAGFRASPPRAPGGSHVRKLQDGDSVVVDDQGHVTAIRAKNGEETQFAPGTASLPPNSDEVLVQESTDAAAIVIGRSDTLEILASYAPGDDVPGQGHVEEERKVVPLVAGVVLFAMSYGPAAFLGATSPLSNDRVLFVPVAGPWIDLVARPKCTSPSGSDQAPVDPCTGETAAKIALVASGLGQAASIVLFALGLPAEAVLVKTPSAAAYVGPFGARGTF